MIETFLECHAIQNLDLSGWTTFDNLNLHSTWNNCYRLTSLDFGDGWSTTRVKDFACAFWATAFEKLDLSSWDFDKSENVSGMFGFMKELREINISSLTSKTGLIFKTSTDESMFNSTTNISKITVGDGLKWNDIRDTQNEATPSPVSPSGKWYSATSGKAYTAADLPDRTADTYVSDTTLLPMKAFAVYSDTNKSLNLYKRHINEIPSVSDMYHERVVTRIYFDFEDSNPICDDDTYSHNHYKRGYFHDVEEYATNINIIDTGIKPNSISGWFSCFSELTSVTGMQKLDLSECSDMYYLFFHDQKLETIDLSNLVCPNVTSVGGVFEQCIGLRNADMSNFYIPKASDLWFIFDQTKIPSIDLSTWTIGRVTSMKSCFAGNSELKEIKLPIGFSFATIYNAICMFDGCTSLTLDCSSWDFPADALHDGFNSRAPNVIAPTVWDDIK